MNKYFILVPVLFALGIAAGVALMYDYGENKTPQPGDELHNSPALRTDTSEHPMANAFVITQVSDSDRIQVLENQIQLLNERIEELEQAFNIEGDDKKKTGTLAIHSPSTVDTPVSSMRPAVTTENLVKAGIDAMLAADIVRRRNEVDMKLLELRDRAAREGYLGTDRYAVEL